MYKLVNACHCLLNSFIGGEGLLVSGQQENCQLHLYQQQHNKKNCCRSSLPTIKQGGPTKVLIHESLGLLKLAGFVFWLLQLLLTLLV